MRTTTLPGGEKVPILGQGTWRMGENARNKRDEIAALREGIDLGMTLIDTAEMYADGGAERVVGEAIAGRRDETFIVSKFYPQNATPEKMRTACEASLKRLGTDRIDLYLLHWRGGTPLKKTLEGFRHLLAEQKLRFAGVSNFDVSDLEELGDGIELIVTDQVLYNLEKRGVEYDVIPWLRQRHRPLMAYSPIEEGLLAGKTHVALTRIAERHGATPVQIALAWVMRSGDVIAIPKAADIAHLREDRGALEITLTKRDLEELDESFAPPSEETPLQTR